MKFEEWFKVYKPSLDTSVIESEFIYEAGASSHQNEIDALQKRIDELEAKREGFVLVPKRCTNNMAHAAKSVDGRLSAFKYSDVWDAMLSAVEQNNGL